MPVLPLQANESEFPRSHLDDGDVWLDLLTADHEAQERISTHPGVLWKAFNVRKHKAK